VRMVNVAAVVDQAAVDALARQPRFAADADAYWRALARNEYHVYAVADVVPAPAGVPAHAQALRIARRAFDAFRRGHATADWSTFLALLTDDVVVWLPGGPFGGRNDGRARAEAFVRSLSADPGTAMTFGDPYRTTTAGSTVSFELEDAGRLGGQPVRNRIVMSFDVRGDRVCALREYLSVLPPTADPPRGCRLRPRAAGERGPRRPGPQRRAAVPEDHPGALRRGRPDDGDVRWGRRDASP